MANTPTVKLNKMQRQLFEYVRMNGPCGPTEIAVGVKGVAKEKVGSGRERQAGITWAYQNCKRFVKWDLFERLEGGKYIAVAAGRGVFAQARRQFRGPAANKLNWISKNLGAAVTTAGVAAFSLRCVLLELTIRRGNLRLFEDDKLTIRRLEEMHDELIEIQRQLSATLGVEPPDVPPLPKRRRGPGEAEYATSEIAAVETNQEEL